MDKRVNRRYKYLRINVYRPIRGVDEDWGAETTQYQFVRQQTFHYMTSAAMGAGVRQLHNSREEHWGIHEATGPAFPVIEEGWLVSVYGPDNTNEFVLIVRKTFHLGRNRVRYVLDENTAIQMDHLLGGPDDDPTDGDFGSVSEPTTSTDDWGDL